MVLRVLKKGFTIVELVIVIAVIAILAAVLIPTFANLVDKANETVDMQLVKQMNTVLEAEEIVDGKPSTIIDAKKVLENNGIVQFKPVDSNNIFYWVSTKNIVLLYNNSKNKVIYPKEYVKEQKLETTWFDLNYTEDDVDIKPVITPNEGQSVIEALIEAINSGNAAKDIYVTLPKNTNINMSTSEFSSLLSSMSVNGQGKKVHIDLNGGTISVDGRDGRGKFNFEVEKNGQVELTNGTYKVENGDKYERDENGIYKIDKDGNSIPTYLFRTAAGASLILRDIKIEGTAFCSIGAPAESNEIILDNVSANVDSYYFVSSNGLTSSNLRIVISNSNLVNVSGLGVLINSTGVVYVDNTTIEAETHCIVTRTGTVEVNNSTLKITSEEAGIFKWNNFGMSLTYPEFPDKSKGSEQICPWGGGNAIPGGALVLGDYASSSTNYAGDVNCKLDNVTFDSVNTNEFPNILVAAKYGKNVNLVYENTNPGNVTFYGMVSSWYGSIKINNISYNYDGTQK